MTESCISNEPSLSIYKPLRKETNEIRLIEILPSEDADAKVEVRLFQRPLKDVSGQFMPFSYVWGDSTDTKPIKVNGISTKVTCNLADFLKQTRTLLPDILAKGFWDKPTIFWADAICINQQDPEERNHQVQLMKSIYSSTPMALAWLGNVKDSHLAVSLAESLSPSYGLEYTSMVSNMNYSAWIYANPHLWAVSEGRNAYWEAFEALVQSPYWTRTWTFQEMVLPTDVLFICGPSLIKWKSIVAVHELLVMLISIVGHSMIPTTSAHQVLYSALERFFGVAVPPIHELHRTRQRIASTSDYPNLTLVQQLASHQATDPRDRVYGLLDVTETSLEADYTKGTAQVYREFVSAWIDEVKDLNFLLSAQQDYRIARHGPNSLPSWAPDWEAISHKEGDTKNYSNMGFFVDSLFDPHDASEQLSARNAHLCDDLSTLVAPGVVAGKIEEVYPCWLSDTSDTDFALDVFQLAIKCTSCFGPQLEPSGSPPGPRLHIFQALFRAIITDVGLHSILQSRDVSLQRSIALCFLVGLLAWAVDSECPNWHSVAAVYLPQLGIPLDQDFSKVWKEDIFKGYSAEYDTMDWEDAAAAMEWTWENAREDIEFLRVFTRKYLESRVKFVTNNGYLGIVTAAQVGGDESHYEHVGPCFVVGLMQGETKQMVDRGEVKIETFEIR